MMARKAEQPERKKGIDFIDANFARAAFLFRRSARARFGLDTMLNETAGNIRTSLRNAGKLVSPFKYTIWRRAGAQQKCIENIERPSRNKFRAALDACGCDRHVQIPRQSDQLTRTFTMSGATVTKKVHARFKNAFVATDRFKKIARFENGDSEKIAGCESRLAFIHTRKHWLLDALCARRV